jgi:hypothetical protein
MITRVRADATARVIDLRPRLATGRRRHVLRRPRRLWHTIGLTCALGALVCMYLWAFGFGADAGPFIALCAISFVLLTR